MINRAIWFAVAAAMTVSSGASAQQSGWQLSASVYGVMPETDIGLDTPRGTADSTLSFSDALDNLDFAFFGAIEAHNGRWGGLIDVLYMDLSFGSDTPGPLFSGLNTGLEQTVITAAALYRVYEDQQTAVDLSAGLRWTKVDNDFEFRPGVAAGRTFGASIDWVDPVIGARVLHQFSDRWSGTGHVDWGGFESDSETWQVLLTANYALNENWTLRGGYRYMSWDYEEGGTRLNIDQSGPIIGVTYQFCRPC